MHVSLLPALSSALHKRSQLSLWKVDNAVRLFNGYVDGFPSLVIDLFDKTLVIMEGKRDPNIDAYLLDQIQDFYREQLASIQCVVHKKRHSPSPTDRRGKVIMGRMPSQEITENGVRYAVNLLLQQDESFFIDNRNLRIWLKQHAHAWEVLNTFAYTGSLGVAALAGGAALVYQTDQNSSYLEVAKQSARMNQIPDSRQKYEAFDFFKVAGKLRSSGRLFDAVILDPPFFSTSRFGRIDLQFSFLNLINKVRPLIKHNGFLIVINNSLYVSGQDFISKLKDLTTSGYVELIETIHVAEDCAGTGDHPAAYPVDPAPFNHPTKIAILRITRKPAS